jgi:hypothetical protein
VYTQVKLPPLIPPYKGGKLEIRYPPQSIRGGFPAQNPLLCLSGGVIRRTGCDSTTCVYTVGIGGRGQKYCGKATPGIITD